MKHTATLVLTRAELQFRKDLLSWVVSNEKYGKFDVITTDSVWFNDQFGMDIKICNSEDGPWCESVLFSISEMGWSEVTHSEVSDSFDVESLALFYGDDEFVPKLQLAEEHYE